MPPPPPPDDATKITNTNPPLFFLVSPNLIPVNHRAHLWLWICGVNWNQKPRKRSLNILSEFSVGMKLLWRFSNELEDSRIKYMCIHMHIVPVYSSWRFSRTPAQRTLRKLLLNLLVWVECYVISSGKSPFYLLVRLCLREVLESLFLNRCPLYATRSKNVMSEAASNLFLRSALL